MKLKEIFPLVPAAGAAVLLIAGLAPAGPLPGGTLDPLDISKFVSPLVIPPAMPRTDKLPRMMSRRTDYYEIAVREIHQQIKPTEFNPTKVWAYGSVNHPGPNLKEKKS
jgi:hypothetical protein